MGYSWSETISVGTNVESVDVDEIRTNINTERTTRAGLGAYTWNNVDLSKDIVDDAEIAELRTATDEAYDLLLDCGAHYTSDDSTHYTTDCPAEDSAADATHYTTHQDAHYSTDDAAHDTTAKATNYVTHDNNQYVTHYNGNCSGKKSYYHLGYKITNNASDK